MSAFHTFIEIKWNSPHNLLISWLRKDPPIERSPIFKSYLHFGGGDVVVVVFFLHFVSYTFPWEGGRWGKGKGKGGGQGSTYFEPLPSYLHYQMVCYGHICLSLPQFLKNSGTGISFSQLGINVDKDVIHKGEVPATSSCSTHLKYKGHHILWITSSNHFFHQFKEIFLKENF